MYNAQTQPFAVNSQKLRRLGFLVQCTTSPSRFGVLRTNSSDATTEIESGPSALDLGQNFYKLDALEVSKISVQFLDGL